MRILALIPARRGSKRLAGKNKRLLGGKPLIVWSIEPAKGVPEVCDILVSTDDPEIAAIAEVAGALVPWMRPAVLATDTATTVDVALHALDWYESERGQVDGLLLLQPTSPFRRRETILRGITIFSQSGRQSVIGVSLAPSHPMWCFRIEGEVRQPFIDQEGLNLRSQDLPAAYSVNGAFYLITPPDLVRYRSFVTNNTVPLVIDSPAESLDIDTEFDWRCAEAWLGAVHDREL
jgi:N-acylneuraminate cytidylyltransferase